MSQCSLWVCSRAFPVVASAMYLQDGQRWPSGGSQTLFYTHACQATEDSRGEGSHKAPLSSKLQKEGGKFPQHAK